MQFYGACVEPTLMLVVELMEVGLSSAQTIGGCV